MARRTNYSYEKNARARAKAAKREAKRAQKAAAREAKKLERDGVSPDEAPVDDEGEAQAERVESED